jgi:predicted O-methyltransferase YrrM
VNENNPKDIIDRIFRTGVVQSEDGKDIRLSANVDRREGEFLQRLVAANKPNRSLEVGFANGISALFICAALAEQDKRHHTLVDPNQSTEWQNAGVTNLKRAGVDFWDLIESPSEVALPNLYHNKEKFDFALIDGWHTFDHALVDFFYIDKMMNVNGVVVIDDVSMPSLNKLARYILSNYSNYKYESHIGTRGDKPTVARKLGGGFFRYCLKTISYMVPRPLRHRFFSGYVLDTDKSLNLDASMIALRKTADDTRSWDSFMDF